MNEFGKMILAEGQEYSLDCYETQLNNNVLVVGGSGTGKTRSIVTPNILEATGSYVISDPKGNLYRKYKDYLEMKGYEVKKLDFTDPLNSVKYNCFHYVHTTQDIVKLAHMLIYQGEEKNHVDPFWDQSSQLMVQALIAYLKEGYDEKEHNLHNLLRCVEMCQIDAEYEAEKTAMDILMEVVEKENKNSYAVSTYKKFRVGANKTLKSVMISVNAKLGLFDTPEVVEMTKMDEVDIPSIGQKKTAVFVVVSDTDRSMDVLANLFFTQAMNELCMYADKCCEDSRLPVPVRFILDDFATNVEIVEFPRMIASIRSRGISTMLMIQSEAQLSKCYKDDGATIIGNCDTYIYLGGNDVKTAQAVAERCDVPVKKILNMPIGTNWIFRRGQQPINGRNFNLDAYLDRRFPKRSMEIVA